MKPAIVAADTNLLRHPTPRRYLTVFEALRNRPVMVLPTVDWELHKHLPIQARDYIESTAKRQGVKKDRKLQEAKAAAASGASNWWQEERKRNDSVYVYAPDLGHEVYAGVVAQLPGAAFTDENDNDQWIYAQAMAHDIDMLASRNRDTIISEVLDEHFVAHGYPCAPVTVRSLWEHTASVAKTEHRPIADVALETMLCTIIPHAWKPSPESAAAAKWSAERFIRNLRTRTKPEEAPDPEREKLAHTLHHTVKAIDEEAMIEHCKAAYAISPGDARETEMRYHKATRAAVRKTGLNLWER